MMNGPVTLAAGIVSAVLSFSVMWTGQEIAEDVTTPRTLTLDRLQYNNDGTVTQQVSGGIPADWAAQIVRMNGDVSSVLCSGYGRGPGYVGEVQTYTTSDWTFDECPTLVVGDVGTASWEFTNEAGLVISITGKFIVGDSE